VWLCHPHSAWRGQPHLQVPLIHARGALFAWRSPIIRAAMDNLCLRITFGRTVAYIHGVLRDMAGGRVPRQEWDDCLARTAWRAGGRTELQTAGQTGGARAGDQFYLWCKQHNRCDYHISITHNARTALVRRRAFQRETARRMPGTLCGTPAPLFHSRHPLQRDHLGGDAPLPTRISCGALRTAPRQQDILHKQPFGTRNAAGVTLRALPAAKAQAGKHTPIIPRLLRRALPR